jgi:dihydroorotate dehydrogenase electron transfer subunit
VPAPPPDARSFQAEVLSVTPCGADAVRLAVRAPFPLAQVRASRFFMLRGEDGLSPAIPRPFSLYLQRGRGGAELEFLIKVMGKGTRALAASPVGSRLRLIGPLGNGWPALGAGDPPWVMVAGGVGSAPFPLAIEQALAGMDGEPPTGTGDLVLVFGAATHRMLYDLELFQSYGVRVFTATMDGSAGHRGTALDLLRTLWRRRELPEQVRLLACGPEPMLEATADLAREHDLDCWLSLETLMGCGVGICNGCPIPTNPEGPLGAWPNAKCCVEGPVFEARAIDLAAMGG